MTNQENKPTRIAEPPKGFVRNRVGDFVHNSNVKQIDKDRDALILQIIGEAKNLSGTITAFKTDALAKVAEFIEYSAKEHGATVGGKKGNVTLILFEGKYKLEVAVNENKAFDERLLAAKSLIDECIKEWMKGSNHNIQALVQKAFETNKNGNISMERIQGLRELKFDDPRWSKAMSAIADSIQVTGSKRYFRAYERDDETGEYVRIPLDAASA